MNFLGFMKMSNLETLQQIIIGNSERTEVTINHEGNEETFSFRKLTDGDLTKLRRIEYNSFKFKVNIDDEGKKKGKNKASESQETEVDTGEFTEKQRMAIYTAIAWSLSSEEEEVPVSFVEQMPKGMPDLLYEKVIEVSGLGVGDLTSVKSFLKDK